jgi:hypothetical protein
MLYSIQEAGVLQTNKTKVHLGLFSMSKIYEQTHFITTIDWHDFGYILETRADVADMAWHRTQHERILAISNVHSLPTPPFLSNSQIQEIVAHPILQHLLIT